MSVSVHVNRHLNLIEETNDFTHIFISFCKSVNGSDFPVFYETALVSDRFSKIPTNLS